MANVSAERAQSEPVCSAEREKRRMKSIVSIKRAQRKLVSSAEREKRMVCKKKPAREDLSIFVRRHDLKTALAAGYFLYVKLAALTLWLSGPAMATNSPGSATSLRSLL